MKKLTLTTMALVDSVNLARPGTKACTDATMGKVCAEAGSSKLMAGIYDTTVGPNKRILQYVTKSNKAVLHDQGPKTIYESNDKNEPKEIV